MKGNNNKIKVRKIISLKYKSNLLFNSKEKQFTIYNLVSYKFLK